MPDVNDISERELLLVKATLWAWRNLFASGVFIACFSFIYAKCENIEDQLIEVSTVLKERIRLDRGDYGYMEPSAPEPMPEPTPELENDGAVFQREQQRIQKHISDFADKK